MPRLIAHRRRLRGGAQAFRNAYGVDVFGPAKVIDGWLKTIGVDAAYRDGFLHLDESTLRRTTDLTAYRSLRSAWKLRKWDSVLKGIQSQVIAGRIYPDRWTANSSVSGRQTISGPGIYGLRADLRDVIRADPGKKIVSVDHHAAEIRVLAAMSGDDSLIRSVLQGDPYQELADATGLDRKLCKTAMLATLYGQGAAAAAAKYGNNTAAAIRSTIFALWPGLGRYAKNLRRLAAAGEPLHTLGGRPVPAQAKPHTALALVTQGSARDVFAICTKRAHDEGLDIWLTYHDALYVQASAADTAHVGEVLLRCMTYELSHGVTLSGQVDISESWH